MSAIVWRIACALLVVLASATSDATACVCSASEGFESDFAEADAVFAGEIVALELAEQTVEGGVVSDMVATFRVIRRWKGPAEERIRVQTCGTQTMGCTCGTPFELGKRFVVFAGGVPLETSSCARTEPYVAIRSDPEHQWVGVEDLVRALDAVTGLTPTKGASDGPKRPTP